MTQLEGLGEVIFGYLQVSVLNFEGIPHLPMPAGTLPATAAGLTLVCKERERERERRGGND